MRSPESTGALSGERKRRVYLDSPYILVLYITVLYITVYLNVSPILSYIFHPISVLMVLYIALLYITVLYITVYLNVSPILSYFCTHGITLEKPGCPAHPSTLFFCDNLGTLT